MKKECNVTGKHNDRQNHYRKNATCERKTAFKMNKKNIFKLAHISPLDIAIYHNSTIK